MIIHTDLMVMATLKLTLTMSQNPPHTISNRDLKNRKGPITLYMEMKLIPMKSIIDVWACERKASPPLPVFIPSVIGQLGCLSQVEPPFVLTVLKR